MFSPREPVLPELSSGPRTARSTLPAPRGSVAGAYLLPELLHGLGVQKTSPEGAGCGVVVELLFVHCPLTSCRASKRSVFTRAGLRHEPTGADPNASPNGVRPQLVLRLVVDLPGPFCAFEACFSPLPYES